MVTVTKFTEGLSMFHKVVKFSVVLVVGFVAYLIGDHIRLYYTHQEAPKVTIAGIAQNTYYKGSIEAKIEAKNPYKIATITATLDGKPFAAIPYKIGNRKFSLPFSIDTTKLEEGLHTIHLNIVDASKHHNTSQETLIFGVDNRDLTASLVDNEFKISQGKTGHIKVQTNKPVAKILVKTMNKEFECHSTNPAQTSYDCLIPVHSEEKPEHYDLLVEVHDHVGGMMKLAGTFEVAEFNFPKSRGFQISAGKIDAEKEISTSSKIFDDAIEQWAKQSPKEKLWAGPFIFPMQVNRIATYFGEIRATPECGRYMHRGVDLVHILHSVVWAAQNGKVVIKERFTMSGNTVVLDHGRGVMTIYAHLDSYADINVGDLVKKGNPVGKTGMTGYAAGDHLHWDMRINGISVDPLEWTQKSF